MAAHLYWRVLVTSTNSGTLTGIGECEMRATNGGADQCNGGTASASSQWSASYVPANAFNNNYAGNPWHSANGGGLPQWLQYQFPAPVDVAELVLQARADGENNAAPKTFSLQWSDDGVAWTTLFTHTTNGTWTTGEVRTFRWDGTTVTEFRGLRVNTQYAYLVSRGRKALSVNTQYAYAIRNIPQTDDPSTSVTKRYWRLLVTEDQRILGGGNYYCNIAELDLIGEWDAEISYGGATFSSTGNFSGATYEPSKAFDGNNGTCWSGDMNLNPTSNPRWLRTDLGSAKKIHKVGLTAFDASAPKAFKIQYSDDDVNWITFIEVTGQTGWSAGQMRIFTPDDWPPVLVSGRKRVAQIIG